MTRGAWVLAAVPLLALAMGTAQAGKSRSMTSKGVTYALDLAGEDAEPVTLVIEPGRSAWLAAAWGPQRHGVTRMGRGFKWTNFASTRGGGIQGDIYLEVEALGGKEFEAAAAAYEMRVADLWRHAGKRLVGKLKERKGKPLKLGRKRVPTKRYTMDLRRQSDGSAMPAMTILFPLAGHLVAVTADGTPDHATGALKSLKLATPRRHAKPRVQHCADTLQEATSFFVLTPPGGYSLVPVVPKEDDKTLIARWRRGAENGAPATLTLVRLSILRNESAADALDHWTTKLSATGEGESDDVQTIEIDGVEAKAVVYRKKKKGAEPTAWGWYGTWVSGPGVFAVQGETTDEPAAEAVAAEVAHVAKTMLTWLNR